MTILDTISEEALDFVKQFVSQRRAALQKRKAVASGNLIDSIAYDVESTKQAVNILLAFEDYGRIIDMRNSSVNYDGFGKNAIDQIINWVEKKGVNNFISGYLQRRKYPPRQYARLISSIAWGIAIKRSKGKFRRKTWWNKAKTAAVANLVNQVAAALPDTTAENIVEKLK